MAEIASDGSGSAHYHKKIGSEFDDGRANRANAARWLLGVSCLLWQLLALAQGSAGITEKTNGASAEVRRFAYKDRHVWTRCRALICASQRNLVLCIRQEP